MFYQNCINNFHIYSCNFSSSLFLVSFLKIVLLSFWYNYLKKTAITLSIIMIMIRRKALILLQNFFVSYYCYFMLKEIWFLFCRVGFPKNVRGLFCLQTFYYVGCSHFPIPSTQFAPFKGTRVHYYFRSTTEPFFGFSNINFSDF